MTQPLPKYSLTACLTWLAAGIAWAAPGDGDHHRQHGSHVHGQSELTLAVEYDRLEIGFESPAANLTGFEHRATTPEQVRTLESAVESLTQSVESAREQVTALRLETGKLAEQIGGMQKQLRSLEIARADVQRLRAQTSAILTGSGTALADDPRLTVRLDQLVLDKQEKVAAEHALASQPLRVLLDSRMRTPGTAQLFAGDNALVFTSEPASQNSLPAHIETIVAPTAPSGLDLRYVLESLSRRGCNEVLIEAGPTLVGEFLRAGLLDELVVYMAPRLLGSDARPMLELTGISSLNDTPTFDVIEVTPLGHDLRMLLRPAQR